MTVLKTIRELGLWRSLAFLAYQIMKRSGAYRLWLPPRYMPSASTVSRLELGQPAQAGAVDEPARDRVRGLASGKVTLFGAVEARQAAHGPVYADHWTAYDRGQIGGRDVKFIWEPARFGWVCDLVRVHATEPDPGLKAFLAESWADFNRVNPPYLGPNWANGQEVALRLIHLVFADSAMGGWLPDFEHAVAVHAARIRLTMLYAFAQNNNHLLSEAAGLLTAGIVLPGHPDAGRWKRLGWQAFNRGVHDQFAPGGAYIQHSANYHRLALQLAVWVAFLARQGGLVFPPDTADRLAAGTRWLLDLCDPETGQVPNLGPNDGARLLPLSGGLHADFRPELQAAARAFLGNSAFAPGPWDETGAWLRAAASGLPAPAEPAARPDGMIRLDHPDLDSRLFLRAAQFTGRPGHADQLHVDLWQGRYNVALDPGTFSYNADPPWDNALQTAHHHNTLTIDGRDQMTRAGRFRYVDQAQATVLETGSARATGEHDGYRALGLVPRRIVEAVPGGWRITDRLLGSRGSAGAGGSRRLRLHWLLPDWPWQIEGTRLSLDGPGGALALEIGFPAGPPFEIVLARAGEALIGPAPPPTMGWFSPTYGVKEPALSFSVTFLAEPPVEIESVWLVG